MAEMEPFSLLENEIYRSNVLKAFTEKLGWAGDSMIAGFIGQYTAKKKCTGSL